MCLPSSSSNGTAARPDNVIKMLSGVYNRITSLVISCVLCYGHSISSTSRNSSTMLHCYTHSLLSMKMKWGKTLDDVDCVPLSNNSSKAKTASTSSEHDVCPHQYFTITKLIPFNNVLGIKSCSRFSPNKYVVKIIL